MKIAIDARFLGPEGTGIGRYTEKLIDKLQDLDKENEYFVILRKANYHLFSPRNYNFKKILVDARWYSLKEQILIPAVLSKVKPDLVHFPHFNIPLFYFGKFVVTIHDLITSDFKSTSFTTRSQTAYKIKHSFYKLVINQAVKRAKKVLVPSHFTKREVLKNFGVLIEKIIVTYESADELFIQAASKKIPDGVKNQLLAKYGIGQPYIIFVGGATPHKNVPLVLETLKAQNNKLRFVHVSPRNFFVEKMIEKAKELGVRERYIVTGLVPNKELSNLFKMSVAFVTPSLSEGFGLPGLEAMASGCPVVASNIPVFKEIYGDAAIYTDPKKSIELVDKINGLMTDVKLRAKMIDRGFKQAKKYSWERMAQETLKVYKQLA